VKYYPYQGKILMLCWSFIPCCKSKWVDSTCMHCVKLWPFDHKNVFVLCRELKQWEIANETMKNLKANMVGKPLPKTFATFGAHSALAAVMVVPVSIAIRLVFVIHANFQNSGMSKHTNSIWTPIYIHT